jgi:predicted ATPase
MGLLLDRWRLASQSEGQIVTVIGEAGIGKSRSIEALQEAISGEPHARIHLQCSPYHSDSALYPLIQHLSRAARFAAADSSSTRIEKLGALFARRAASDGTAIPFLTELLSIPVSAPAASLSLTQHNARRRPLRCWSMRSSAWARPIRCSWSWKTRTGSTLPRSN